MSFARHTRQLAKACAAGALAALCTSAWAQPSSTSTSVKLQPPLSLYGIYGFQSVAGVLPSTSNTIRCGDVCDRISAFDSFYDVVRLSGGRFAAPRSDSGQSFSWWVGNNLSDVTRGRLDKWRSDARAPRWTPAIPGFALKHVVALKETTDVFVGVWEPDGQANGRRLVGLFSDGEDRRIERLRVTGACIIATVEAPVLAVSSEISLHGEMWPVDLIVRRPQAEMAGILGFVLFPDSIKCQAAPRGLRK